MSETPPEPPVELGILTLVKKGLNVAATESSFDDELIMYINGAIADLTRLGLGPAAGFEIEDDAAKWSDFLGHDKRFNAAKRYTVNQVRLAFDPPDNYFTVQAIRDLIEKDEFTLNVAREDALRNPIAASSPGVNLEITGGLPYARKIRVSGGATVWPTVADFEVRSQIRMEQDVNSRLLGDLQAYITPTIDGTDIVLDIEMSGAQTRQVPSGYYDLVISDPGTADQRAISVLSGKVMVSSLVTAADNG